MIRHFPISGTASYGSELKACEHRSVAADGRIVCKKITWGESQVGPALCRACPVQAVNCTHLRFALRHLAASPLVVRFNGRTEVWNDEPPALRFEQAACACQVVPITSPTACAACPLRQPVPDAPAEPAAARPATARRGKVVPFEPPERGAVAAAG
jgi:hypothetical protein